MRVRVAALELQLTFLESCTMVFHNERQHERTLRGERRLFRINLAIAQEFAQEARTRPGRRNCF